MKRSNFICPATHYSIHGTRTRRRALPEDAVTTNPDTARSPVSDLRSNRQDAQKAGTASDAQERRSRAVIPPMIRPAFPGIRPLLYRTYRTAAFRFTTA